MSASVPLLSSSEVTRSHGEAPEASRVPEAGSASPLAAGGPPLRAATKKPATAAIPVLFQG